MKKLSCCGLLVLAAIGCGKSDTNQASNTNANTPAGSGAATAPAAIVKDGVGTEPGEVVALFLDSLRRGDETAANGVLTAQAQAELAKTDYVIQPLGTPEGKYKIGRVGFLEGDTTSGLVECLWTEPSPVAGQPPIEMEIVCEVHKEPQGWRISGLAVKMSGTDDAIVLDFENAQSLQQALEGASGQAQGAPAQGAPVQGTQTVQQAGAGMTPPLPTQPGLPAVGVGQPNMPSLATQPPPQQFNQQAGLPQFPATNPGMQQPQNGQLPPLPTQIALPPTQPAVNR